MLYCFLLRRMLLNPGRCLMMKWLHTGNSVKSWNVLHQRMPNRLFFRAKREYRNYSCCGSVKKNKITDQVTEINWKKERAVHKVSMNSVIICRCSTKPTSMWPSFACPANQHLEGTIKEKKPTNLCAPREFLKNYRMNKPFAYPRCVIYVSCSVHLNSMFYVRKGSWAFYRNCPQFNEVRTPDHVVLL